MRTRRSRPGLRLWDGEPAPWFITSRRELDNYQDCVDKCAAELEPLLKQTIDHDRAMAELLKPSLLIGIIGGGLVARRRR